ncbi:hypothetical protein M3676_19630 [Metabacillus litoralis]|nr:hypothetical protein [Metabacillus litoralis]
MGSKCVPIVEESGHKSGRGSRCVPIVEESGQKSGHGIEMCPDSGGIGTQIRSWDQDVSR